LIAPAILAGAGFKGILFMYSLTEAQLTTFHKLLDSVSETAADEIQGRLQGRCDYDAGDSGQII